MSGKRARECEHNEKEAIHSTFKTSVVEVGTRFLRGPGLRALKAKFQTLSIECDVVKSAQAERQSFLTIGPWLVFCCFRSLSLG